MIDEINSLLELVSERVNTGAADYAMSMALFPCQVSEGEVDTIASSALPKPASIYEVEPATTQELLDSIEYAVTHTENSPSPYMNTGRHKNDFSTHG